LRASAFVIPTDAPEADGTFAWNSTTLVIAEVEAGGETGLGYTYADASLVDLIPRVLGRAIDGIDALDVPRAWVTMRRAVRNLGQPGLCATAIAAVDAALWDLKGKLLGTSLADLFGCARDEVAVYGSGGFTSYSDERLAEQLGTWTGSGIKWVKMKIGSEPERDLGRVSVARRAIGAAGLFVDANGAYSRKQALDFAERFADLDVSWFEEPVSSDDLEGLHLLRDRGPGGLAIAAGEYGYEPGYFRRMLAAGAVDVLQADASRCGGLTGFLQVGALCEAFGVPLSAHCAPALHLAAAAALPRFVHQEWFHDHVRIEAMLFDGAPPLENGAIRPDRSRPGLGLALKRADAARFETGRTGR
jgi:L-alanine-DL-glutamate epimerase-like enolase superfamily enzyme